MQGELREDDPVVQALRRRFPRRPKPDEISHVVAPGSEDDGYWSRAERSIRGAIEENRLRD